MSSLRAVFNELVHYEVELWTGVEGRLKAELALSLAHFEPMAILERRGLCRVNDLATELNITTGGASKLIDRMEADGLCQRQPNPVDRRSSLIELTPSGRASFARAVMVVDDELDRRLGSVLNGTGAEQLRTTLRRLRVVSQRLDLHAE